MVGLGTAFLEKFFKSLKKFLRILVCLELIKKKKLNKFHFYHIFEEFLFLMNSIIILNKIKY